MISVIITTYKREAKMVKRAINSVLAQTLGDFELTVVDDNPSEVRADYGIEAAVKSFNDPRLSYVVTAGATGACGARNTGIKYTVGDYIGFLDDDDEYLPDKLKLQAEALDKNPDAGMVIGNFYIRKLPDMVKSEADYGVAPMRLVNIPYDPDRISDQIIGNNKVGTPNPLIRRVCFETCGDFDESMPSAQDLDMWIRIMKSYRAVIIGEPVYIQNLHRGERISVNFEKKLQGNEKLIQKNRAYLDKHKRAYSRLVLVQAKRHIQLGDKGEWKCFARCVKLWPGIFIKGFITMIYWEFKYR